MFEFIIWSLCAMGFIEVICVACAIVERIEKKRGEKK